MAFPTNPNDGDTYQSVNGSTYQYTAATDSWQQLTGDSSTIITTLGDLIQGDASGVAERLPRGNFEQILQIAASGLAEWVTPTPPEVPDLSGKNFLINGDMLITQRNVTGNPIINTSSYVSIDRWYVFVNGGVQGDYTLSQVVGDTQSPFAMRLTRNPTAGAADTRNRQVIESSDARNLAGGEVMLSFRARAGAGYTPVNKDLVIQLTTGTGIDQGSNAVEFGTWTGALTPGNTTIQLTTDFQDFEIPVTINADVQEIAVGFLASWVGASAPANDYYEVVDAQLEVGDVATPFDWKSFGDVLALCGRFYRKSYGYSTIPGSVSVGDGHYFAWVATTAQKIFTVGFNVAMRINPTVLAYAPSTGAVNSVDANGVARLWASAGPNSKAISIGTDDPNGLANIRYHYTANAEL